VVYRAVYRPVYRAVYRWPFEAVVPFPETRHLH
jgi:hypothetical protein